MGECSYYALFPTPKDGDSALLRVESLQDLVDENPEDLYSRLVAMRGTPIDRCVLYEFRCGVYYARGGRDQEHVKWWNWADGKNWKGPRYPEK